MPKPTNPLLGFRLEGTFFDKNIEIGQPTVIFFQEKKTNGRKSG